MQTRLDHELIAIRLSLDRLERRIATRPLTGFLAAVGCAVILAATFISGAYLQSELRILSRPLDLPLEIIAPPPPLPSPYDLPRAEPQLPVPPRDPGESHIPDPSLEPKQAPPATTITLDPGSPAEPELHTGPAPPPDPTVPGHDLLPDPGPILPHSEQR